MKKKLAAVTMLLATSLVAAGCGNDGVTYRKDSEGRSIIFSIKNNDKEEVYTAETLLKDLQDSSTAVNKLYSEVSRQVFTKYATEVLLKDNQAKKDSIRKEAIQKVDDFKDKSSSSAKEEGTDYDTYLEAQLKNLGVKTLEELEALYYYQGLKEEIVDDFVKEDDHYNYFLQKYLETYTPFQLKHVLVAANSADTKYKDGTMTADNARNLLNIMKRFINGDSFTSVVELTDDKSSKDNGGIMPFNGGPNYVSEFRFAPYALEIFNNATTLDERYDIAADLHIVNKDSTSTDYVSKDEFKDSNLYSVYANGIESINMKDIMKLEEPITNKMAGAYNYFTKEGNTLTSNAKPGVELPTIAEQPYEMNVSKYNDEGELNAKYYEEYELQRNQIFNETLNTHKTKFIELTDEAHLKTPNKVQINGKYYLADGENGNPIFFALASTGVHFMSMVWNSYNPQTVAMSDEAKNSLAKYIYDNDEAFKAAVQNVENGAYYTAATEYANTNKTFDLNAKLNSSYFRLYDSSVKNLEEYKYTYIGRNGAYKSKQTLTKNSNDILSDISGYASQLEYYIFDAIVYQSDSNLIKGVNYSVSFYDKDSDNVLYDLLKEHVQDKLSGTDDSFASSVKSAAETYGSKLAREAEVKKALENWKYKDPTDTSAGKEGN